MVYAENYQHFIWHHAHQHNSDSLCTEVKTPKNWPYLQNHTVASVEAQLSYYCKSLLISPHSQYILMLPMQANDEWENTTIMFIA